MYTYEQKYENTNEYVKIYAQTYKCINIFTYMYLYML
jgi:hypothetical protein